MTLEAVRLPPSMMSRLWGWLRFGRWRRRSLAAASV
jgi:hypothetical protein